MMRWDGLRRLPIRLPCVNCVQQLGTIQRNPLCEWGKKPSVWRRWKGEIIHEDLSNDVPPISLSSIASWLFRRLGTIQNEHFFRFFLCECISAVATEPMQIPVVQAWNAKGSSTAEARGQLRVEFCGHAAVRRGWYGDETICPSDPSSHCFHWISLRVLLRMYREFWIVRRATNCWLQQWLMI